MKHKYILALDHGATTSMAMLVYQSGEVAQTAEKECRHFSIRPGWVEQNPAEIWSSQYAVMGEVMARVDAGTSDIAAIGITNQRETVIVWDKVRDLPVYPAIGRPDRRTSDYCDQLLRQGFEPMIRERTGLYIDACFSATKVKWILDNVAGTRAQAENGELALFTIDSFLIWKLTGGKLHITDSSNAAQTMLFNIHTGQWDPELLQLFDIPISMLPAVRWSSEVYGNTTIMAPGGSGIPIAAIAADQQAALFGQNCIEPGMVNTTYDIGCSLLMHTGDRPIRSKSRMNTTIAWTRDGKTDYALQGIIGGAVLEWLRDGLTIIQSLKDLEQVARVETAEDIVIVPALSGPGVPYDKNDTRTTIFGITPGTTKGHIALAVLKSIAYQTYDVLKAMEADTGLLAKDLRVDGPGSFNGLLMQFQCGVLDLYVVKPKVAGTSALGAAYLAGLAAGFWSLEEINGHWSRDRNFRSHISREQAQKEIKRWHQAVEAASTWPKASDLP
jgi:glycerol kinase